MEIINFLKHLKSLWPDQIIAVEELEPKKPQFKNLKKPLPAALSKILKKRGLAKLYEHQAEAIDFIRSGENTAVLTPAASGKTLIYNLPVLESILKNPKAKALYLFPTKALAQDQAKNLLEFIKELEKSSRPKISVEIFDGDTHGYKRKKIKTNLPNIIISNPDMVHLSFLAYHSQWVEFLKNLKYVVVDEAHYYRGVVGAHFNQIIQRFNRILKSYGARPQYIALSATLANPEEFLSQLFGEEFKIVQKNGAGTGKKYFVFWRPIASPYQEAKRIFIESVKAGLKTIAFTKSRKITELIYSWAASENHELKEKISAYRAGYLAKERREIEEKLFNDRLLGVVATSALELGIDIGGLDVCILVGYPGTLISTRQRMGRVGRGEREALVVLVGLLDALDHYFLEHPKEFLGKQLESALVDDQNKFVVSDHLICASRETPLLKNEGLVKKYSNIVEKLLATGKLFLSKDGQKIFTKISRPHQFVNLRTIGQSFRIKSQNTGKTIGQIEYPKVLRECYPGAIYLHAGSQWQVWELRLAEKLVLATEARVDYFTEPRSHEDVEIIKILKQKTSAGLSIYFGEIRVTERVLSFVKKRISDQKIIDEIPLALDPYVFETKALWFEVPEKIKDKLLEKGLDLAGGLHATEHALISLMPIFILCDRFDLGGVSYQYFPESSGSQIFIYDAYPGGIGLTEKAFEISEKLFESSLELVKKCDCEEGCPACIQSPKCGNGNKPLDKLGALFILNYLKQNSSNLKKVVLSEEKNAGSLEFEAKLPQDKEKIIFLDLETKQLFDEVGGRFPERLGVSLVVTYDSFKKEYFYFEEADVLKLLDQVLAAEMVVGFNIHSFDWPALQPYFDYNLSKIPTFDILDYIFKKFGFRISLNALAKSTLGLEKAGDGLKAVEWFRAGEMSLLKEYCRRDVEIMKEIYEFGKKYGYLLFEKNDQILRLPVEW